MPKIVYFKLSEKEHKPYYLKGLSRDGLIFTLDRGEAYILVDSTNNLSLTTKLKEYMPEDIAAGISIFVEEIDTDEADRICDNSGNLNGKL